MSAAQPRIGLPIGACDAHCHVFGPGDEFPYDPKAPYRPTDSSKFDLAALHRRLGFSRTVIVHPAAHGTDHSVTLDAIAVDPRNRRGSCLLDMSFDDADFERLDAGGIRAIRLNYIRAFGAYPDAAYVDFVQGRARELGWHVLFHLNAEDIDDVAEVARRMTVPFVIDHMAKIDMLKGMGQPAVATLLELARRDEAWIKVSGADRCGAPPFDSVLPLIRAVIETAPDRTLWGTDFPHPNPRFVVEDTELVDLIAVFAPTEDERRRLLVDNPARLYGFA